MVSKSQLKYILSPDVWLVWGLFASFDAVGSLEIKLYPALAKHKNSSDIARCSSKKYIHDFAVMEITTVYISSCQK